MSEFHHISVLRDELVALLGADNGTWYVDLTGGGGGHSSLLLERHPNARLLVLDRDPVAITHLKARLAPFGDRVIVHQACFDELADVLDTVQFGTPGPNGRTVDGVMADLGVSSPQMDVADRGFAFAQDGPLDMRMGADGPTAAEWLDAQTELSLTRVLQKYGDVPSAGRVARAILQDRALGRVQTTGQLAALCERLRDRRLPRHHHPATLVFQAIRIAVNDELGQLERMLDVLPTVIAVGGTVAIISFHSLEDRMVKQRFAAWTTAPPMPRGLPVTGLGRQMPFERIGKSVEPSEDEVRTNPRSRSARVRAVRRVTPERP